MMKGSDDLIMEVISAICEGFLIGFKYTGIGIGFIVGVCCAIWFGAICVTIFDKINDKLNLKGDD